MTGVEAPVHAAADILCRYPFHCWRYGDSIGFEGLCTASKLTGDSRFSGFVHGAIKAWIPRARPYTFWDNTAPGHAMCLSYEKFGDDAVVAAANDLAAYLRSRRKCRGVFVAFEVTPLHAPFSGEPVTADDQALLDDPGAGVFVDCMHFDAPFFAHLGHIMGSSDLIDEAVRQACASIDVLQDSRSGLFSHFYLERTDQLYGIGWSRGQGWALLGLLDVLEYAPASFDGRDQILTSLRRLGRAIADSQDTSGHWHGRIGDPESRLETSAAFFFSAGIWRGFRLGVFGDDLLPVAERAWSAGLGCLSAEGTLAGVSAEVWPSPALSHYRGVPMGLQVPWGQGAFLLAASERGVSH